LPGSCRWESVSTPEPVRSIYQNVFSSTIPKYGPPLGETLTWPSAARGAEAIQITFCCNIHSVVDGGMVSKKAPILIAEWNAKYLTGFCLWDGERSLDIKGAF
jgi:hypothetical protein